MRRRRRLQPDGSFAPTDQEQRAEANRKENVFLVISAIAPVSISACSDRNIRGSLFASIMHHADRVVIAAVTIATLFINAQFTAGIASTLIFFSGFAYFMSVNLHIDVTRPFRSGV